MLSSYACQYLKGVGPYNALKLKKLGIETAGDLLLHLPLRYEDRTVITPMASLAPNAEKKIHVLIGTLSTVNRLKKPRPQLYAVLSDSTGQINLRFIHSSRAEQEKFACGKKLMVIGEVRLGAFGLEMIHPEYHFVESFEAITLPATLTPIYGTTQGLSQRSLLQFSEQALDVLRKTGTVEELLPQNIIAQWQLPSLLASIVFLHRPPKETDQHLLLMGKHPAQRRLILEELLAHRLVMLKRRDSYQSQKAMVLTKKMQRFEILLKRLPFQLTQAQQRVLHDIEQDLKLPYPMMRLLQGDVGSGKTIVAVFAALTAIDHETQVAFMAPTELLAEQHYHATMAWLSPLNIRVALLTGRLSKRSRETLLHQLACGDIDILVGTHAMFQAAVIFKNLSFVIIDEQHRFGVNQRLALKEKGMQQGYVPHQLMMTATPIPRTLAMSVYADLAYSVIDELPPGRQPITTLVLGNDRREEVMARILTLCEKGQQVYWVCPLIEESEVLQCQAAEKSYEELCRRLPALKIGLLHGRMKSLEKETIMQTFKHGDLQVLVATTVIEVGVDVPNASLMVIENAERMGLAQLHQLRGRVGRGALSSYCVLLYQAPLSFTAKERLQMMRETQDGFKIAEKDLMLRGAGEMLGTQQTGEVAFRVANLCRDRDFVPRIESIAFDVYQKSPANAQKLIDRWLGAKEIFGGV